MNALHFAAILVPLALPPAGSVPALLAPADTVRLAELQRLAVDADPRIRELGLLERASALSDANLGTARLPDLALRGEAGWQSETVAFPVASPGFTAPRRDRYEAALDAEWTAWDAGRTQARRDVESARLGADLASVRADVWEVRSRVSDAYFGAELLRRQIDALELAASDLRARLVDLRSAVSAGVALPGDTATLRAELLRVEQRADGLASDRSAALEVLRMLTGAPLDANAEFALPDVTAEVARTRTALAARAAEWVLPEGLRVHPRFDELDAARDATGRRATVLGADRRPVVAAFGSLALGTPGYEQFTTDIHEYWRAGVVVRWTPWEWDRTDRELQRIDVDRAVLDQRERAFVQNLLRALQAPAQRIDHLTRALDSDARILSLREVVADQARALFGEREISAADYADALSDVLDARLERALHETELVREQTRYLLMLGLELPR